MPAEFGFAWSCNRAGPDWEQPDSVTITALTADSLKNTSEGFENGQPSSGNTVAADPEAGHGREVGGGGQPLCSIPPEDHYTQTTRSASCCTTFTRIHMFHKKQKTDVVACLRSISAATSSIL